MFFYQSSFTCMFFMYSGKFSQICRSCLQYIVISETVIFVVRVLERIAMRKYYS